LKRAIAALALVLVPATAAANGRFPYANQLVVAPTDPTRLTMRTTYGVLQSFDAGARWLWLCETSIGYGGTLDPAIAVTAEGRLLAGLFGAGVATSSDRGCTFTSDAAPFTGLYVIDLAVDPSNPSRVVAITSSGSAGGTFTVVVGESVDGGATWKQLGAALPPTFNAETIEVAASRKERLYASGSRTGVPSDAGADGEVGPAGRVGLLYRSDDHGASWKELPVDLEGGLAAFVSAVDPKDPDRIYVRVSADPKSGSTTDHLLFSPDGGASFTRVAASKGSMLGLALSPDGSKIAYGGPSDGVVVASTKDHVFTAKSAVGARCLTWAAAGLYACSADFPDGFTLGLSKDDGASFAPLYKLAQLSQLECPSGTPTRTLCPREWPATRDKLGIPTPDAGPVDAGPVTPTTPPADEGCGCHLGRAAGSSGLVFALLLAVRAARRRR